METEIKFCPRCGAKIAPLTSGYVCPKCGWGEGGSNDIVEIPFGAHDSELQHWEYTLPEGYTAEIKDGKVVVKKNESEDERIRKHIIKILDRLAPCHWDGNEKAKCIAYLEKQKEQKPTEWSEEDEKMLGGIIERGNSEIPRGECGLTPNQIAWLETRLKSLRPNHWKPSEEQMEWLEQAVRLSADKPAIHGVILSLYNGLKKLL